MKFHAERYELCWIDVHVINEDEKELPTTHVSFDYS